MYALIAPLLQRVRVPTQAPAPSNGRRLAAGLIDLAITLPLFGLAALLVQGCVQGDAFDDDSLLHTLVLGLLMQAMYFATLEMSDRRATLGQRLLGLQVVTTDGRALGLEAACRRHLLRLADIGLLGLGTWWGLRDGSSRCWQDRATGSRVVAAPARGLKHRAAARRSRLEDAAWALVGSLLCVAGLQQAATGWQDLRTMAEIRTALQAAQPYLHLLAQELALGQPAPSESRLAASLREHLPPAARLRAQGDGRWLLSVDAVGADARVEVQLTPVRLHHRGPAVSWRCESAALPAWALPAGCNGEHTTYAQQPLTPAAGGQR